MTDFNIKPHTFLDSLIHQSVHDTTIQGRSIPKGYVSATNILAIASELTGKNKQWTKYFKSESTQEFLIELSAENNQPILNNSVTPYGTTEQLQGVHPLVIVINGGSPHLQGTWVHLEVALHLCQWASPKVAVWGSKTLRRVLDGQFLALTEDAKKAERADAIAAYRETLFGRGNLNNAEYVELCKECREDHGTTVFGF